MRSFKLLICIELCITALLHICGKNLGLSEAFSLTNRRWNAFRGGGNSNNKSESNNKVHSIKHNGKHEHELFNGSRREQASKEGGSNSNSNSNNGNDIAEGGSDIELPVEFVAETNLPTDIGHFRLRAYRLSDKGKINSELNDAFHEYQGKEPVVIYASHLPPFEDDNYNLKDVPIRVHDQCLTSEVFRSQRCDCREQLRSSLQYIHKHGGAIIYLQQEGRGIGLANKVAAYSMQDIGMDTVEANLHFGFPEDNRSYGMVPSILNDLGIKSIQLMTNNPRKVIKLKKLGVKVTGTVPVVSDDFITAWNRKYITTKVNRMAHMNYEPLLTSSINKQSISQSSSNNSLNSLMVPRAGGSLNANAQAPINPSNNVNDPDCTANTTDISQSPDQPGTMVAQNAVISAVHNDTTISASSPAATATIPQDQQPILASQILKSNGYCFGKQSVIDAIAAIKNGEMVVVVDDYNRENEGDFIVSAELLTPQTLAKLIRFSSGVVCVAMDDDRADALDLPYMLVDNEDPKETAFTVTVDATKEHGTTTGISATDRCNTINLLSNPKSASTDFTRPGHIFPLRAKSKGVMERDGHTEATVDLMKLAGLEPVGVLCEIVSEDNPVEMAQLPELMKFSKEHGYVLTSIADLIMYKKETGL